MHGLGCKRRRTLHCQNGQNLEQVILHHIAQCTAVVIISAAGLDAHVLECRNLDARNVLCVPSVGKNRVGKADGLHVAHHFLAQIMVDAVNIFRTERRF